jgi:hypothetical protein
MGACSTERILTRLSLLVNEALPKFLKPLDLIEQLYYNKPVLFARLWRTEEVHLTNRIKQTAPSHFPYLFLKQIPSQYPLPLERISSLKAEKTFVPFFI